MNPEIAKVLNGESDGCIVCGDCLEIMADMPDGCVDAVVTDPPYGIKHLMQGGGWAHNMEYIKDGAEWDAHPIDAERLSAAISKGTNSVVWGGNYFTLPPQRGWLVWRKRGDGFSMAQAELAWTNIAMPVRAKDYFNIDQKPCHPTQKPVEIMMWALSFLPNADIILDPFCGSGTTCVAAKKLGRKYVGIDISEKYCRIARNRVANTEKPLFPGDTR